MSKREEIFDKIWCYSAASIALILIVFLIVVPPPKQDDRLYQNFDGKIVAIGSQTAPSHNKFHNPVEYHKILIQMQTDTTLFFEWETTAEKYYNYKINQVVHFDFICKDRVFKINQ